MPRSTRTSATFPSGLIVHSRMTTPWTLARFASSGYTGGTFLSFFGSWISPPTRRGAGTVCSCSCETVPPAASADPSKPNKSVAVARTASLLSVSSPRRCRGGRRATSAIGSPTRRRAPDHELLEELTGTRTRQRDDDEVHEEEDGDAQGQPAGHGLTQQQLQSRARRDVDRGGRRGNEEVQEHAERMRWPLLPGTSRGRAARRPPTGRCGPG